MKIYLLLFISFLLPFIGFSQESSKITDLRSEYYALGMKISVQRYDSLLNGIIKQRTQNKINEQLFLQAYDSLEKMYKGQSEIVADIAAKWSIMYRQRPSKQIKVAIDLLQKGRHFEAIQKLQDQFASLRPIEKDFAYDLCQLVGQNSRAERFLDKQIADSLAAIWANRYATNPHQDTLQYLSEKIYIAERFYKLNKKPEAIGTLLRAQEVLSFLPNQDSPNVQMLKADLCYLLGTWQLATKDINGAFVSAKIAHQLYVQLKNLNVQKEYAASLHLMASVYQIGGGTTEADTFFKKAIVEYEQLVDFYPERFEPNLADVLQEYAQLEKYLDRYKDYDETINRLIQIRLRLSKLGFPFYQQDLVNNYIELGQKLMNTDVKIFLAQDEWAKGLNIIEPLYTKHPVLFGNTICELQYRLGGAKIALKMGHDALPFFEKSLKVRAYLYQLAPSIYSKDYLDVLTQNATLNGLDNNKALSIAQLDKAIELATKLGESERAETIKKYKKELLTK